MRPSRCNPPSGPALAACIYWFLAKLPIMPIWHTSGILDQRGLVLSLHHLDVNVKIAPYVWSYFRGWVKFLGEYRQSVGFSPYLIRYITPILSLSWSRSPKSRFWFLRALMSSSLFIDRTPFRTRTLSQTPSQKKNANNFCKKSSISPKQLIECKRVTTLHNGLASHYLILVRKQGSGSTLCRTLFVLAHRSFRSSVYARKTSFLIRKVANL